MDAKDGSSVIEERPGAGQDVETRESDGDGGSDIRCPICRWTPKAEDRWSCQCNHSWNTFDTGGVCPNCLHRWAYTQCLACHGWSLHSDWYPKS